MDDNETTKKKVKTQLETTWTCRCEFVNKIEWLACDACDLCNCQQEQCTQQCPCSTCGGSGDECSGSGICNRQHRTDCQGEVQEGAGICECFSRNRNLEWMTEFARRKATQGRLVEERQRSLEELVRKNKQERELESQQTNNKTSGVVPGELSNEQAADSETEESKHATALKVALRDADDMKRYLTIFLHEQKVEEINVENDEAHTRDVTDHEIWCLLNSKIRRYWKDNSIDVQLGAGKWFKRTYFRYHPDKAQDQYGTNISQCDREKLEATFKLIQSVKDEPEILEHEEAPASEDAPDIIQQEQSGVTQDEPTSENESGSTSSDSEGKYESNGYGNRSRSPYVPRSKKCGSNAKRWQTGDVDTAVESASGNQSFQKYGHGRWFDMFMLEKKVSKRMARDYGVASDAYVRIDTPGPCTSGKGLMELQGDDWYFGYLRRKNNNPETESDVWMFHVHNKKWRRNCFKIQRHEWRLVLHLMGEPQMDAAQADMESDSDSDMVPNVFLTPTLKQNSQAKKRKAKRSQEGGKGRGGKRVKHNQIQEDLVERDLSGEPGWKTPGHGSSTLPNYGMKWENESGTEERVCEQMRKQEGEADSDQIEEKLRMLRAQMEQARIQHETTKKQLEDLLELERNETKRTLLAESTKGQEMDIAKALTGLKDYLEASNCYRRENGERPTQSRKEQTVLLEKKMRTIKSQSSSADPMINMLVNARKFLHECSQLKEVHVDSAWELMQQILVNTDFETYQLMQGKLYTENTCRERYEAALKETCRDKIDTDGMWRRIAGNISWPNVRTFEDQVEAVVQAADVCGVKLDKDDLLLRGLDNKPLMLEQLLKVQMLTSATWTLADKMAMCRKLEVNSPYMETSKSLAGQGAKGGPGIYRLDSKGLEERGQQAELRVQTMKVDSNGSRYTVTVPDENAAAWQPGICWFFEKGDCRRGKECSFRHESQRKQRQSGLPISTTWNRKSTTSEGYHDRLAVGESQRRHGRTCDNWENRGTYRFTQCRFTHREECRNTQMVDAIGVMPVTISTDQSIKMRECRVVEHRNIIDKCDTLQEREGLVFKFNMQVCTTTDDT